MNRCLALMVATACVVPFPAAEAGSGSCRGCPTDMSSPGDSWVYDGADGGYVGDLCDASPNLCQDGDPDPDSGDADPCNTCTSEPIGSPSYGGDACAWPAVLVCPDPACELDGEEVWILEMQCSQ